MKTTLRSCRAGRKPAAPEPRAEAGREWVAVTGPPLSGSGGVGEDALAGKGPWLREKKNGW